MFDCAYQLWAYILIDSYGLLKFSPSIQDSLKAHCTTVLELAIMIYGGIDKGKVL
jgi:hypothetical protein